MKSNLHSLVSPPAVLSESDLLERVRDSIQRCGWTAICLSAEYNHAYELVLSNGDTNVVLLVHIWNLTAKTSEIGAVEFALEEARMPNGTHSLRGKTMFLGWSEEYQVIAGFSCKPYVTPTSFASTSAVLQREHLQELFRDGFFPVEFGAEGYAVFFLPEFFVAYVSMTDLEEVCDDSKDLVQLIRLLRK